MTQEIKAYLPENNWLALGTCLSHLIYELGFKNLSRLELILEVDENCPLRSISFGLTSENDLSVVVRTAKHVTGMLPSEFILGTFGWNLVNDGRVRWQRIFSKDAKIGAVVLDAQLVLELAYKVSKSIWFTIESDNMELVNEYTQGLWHYKDNDKFLCLPGTNLKTAREAS